VGAGAEERGVPERKDAAVAEDEIERDSEEREDRDLVQDQRVLREQEVRRDGREPHGELERPPARGVDQPGSYGRRTHQRAASRAKRPCGRSISTAIMTL